MKVFLVDVFTSSPGEGNPAAVVLEAGGLTAEEMARIAVATGLETTFVTGSSLRYFQPSGAPMTICGHGTLAALAAMGREGRFRVQAPVGELKVAVEPHLLGMAMPPVIFGEPVVPALAAEALGLSVDDLATEGFRFASDEPVPLPILPGGAGRPKLLIPIRSFRLLDSIRPDPVRVEAACAATGTTGLYPFTLSPRSPVAVAEARQLPAGAGILEDPVTGVAAVALAWYMWKHGLVPGCGTLQIEQGHAMGRPGRVLVRQEPDGATWIFGTAVMAGGMEV